jgi:hypothetical protein
VADFGQRQSAKPWIGHEVQKASSRARNADGARIGRTARLSLVMPSVAATAERGCSLISMRSMSVAYCGGARPSAPQTIADHSIDGIAGVNWTRIRVQIARLSQSLDYPVLLAGSIAPRSSGSMTVEREAASAPT